MEILSKFSNLFIILSVINVNKVKIFNYYPFRYLLFGSSVMGIKFTYNSELFERFLGIHENDTYAVIRFYEQHEHELEFMTYEEQFIILCYYTNALYATEDPEKHLEYVEKVIQESIIGDIQYVDGQDIFVHALYQKVNSLLRLRRRNEAVHVAKQLVNIAPPGAKYLSLLKKCLLLRRPQWVRQSLGAALWGMVGWTTLAVLRLMMLEPFFPVVDSVAVVIQNMSIVVAIIGSMLATFGHYYFVHREVRKAYHQQLKKAYSSWEE